MMLLRSCIDIIFHLLAPLKHDLFFQTGKRIVKEKLEKKKCSFL